jgi:DNA-binding transcriptional regulator YbjK
METINHIKAKAVELIKEGGIINLSRSNLCDAAGVPVGSFQHVMGCTFETFLAELITEHNGELPTNVVTRGRVTPILRKEQILNSAIGHAIDVGFYRMTREGVAERADVSPGTIQKYFKTMPQLKRAVMRAAVQREEVVIVAQGLANDDPQARKAPDVLKQKAADYIGGC